MVDYYCTAEQMGRHDSLGEFEQSVLLAIAHLGPGAYGVPIRQEIEGRTGRTVAVGALYTALDRLERKGYVSSSRSDPDPVRGGRSRRHFQVEQRGLTALAQTRSLLDRMWDGVSIDPDSAR